MIGQRLAVRLPRGGLAAAIAILALGTTCTLATAAGARTPRLHFTSVKRAMIPVLAEGTAAYPAGRLRSAKVRIYDVTPPKAHRRGRSSAGAAPRTRRRLVGTSRTGTRGITIVRLREKTARRRLLRIEVSGGRMGSKRFGGTMITQLQYAPPHAVYVNPVSTLVARDQILHPRHKLSASKATVRRFLRLPRFFDFAGDMSATKLFDGVRFLAIARSHGGFDRYVNRLAGRLGRAKPMAFQSADATIAASTDAGACWQQAAQSTVGFATYLGFQNVPSEGLPAPMLCGRSASARASSVGPAHTAGLGLNDVFSDALGIAGLTYSIFSGQQTGQQLTQIQNQLDMIQTEMTQVQNTLAQLQSEIAEVGAIAIQGNISNLAADAAPTISTIKFTSDDVDALMGDLYQIVCPSTGCTTQRYGSVTAAFNAICYPYPSNPNKVNPALGTQCNNFSQAAYATILSAHGERPKQAVSTLAHDALGSAGVGGPKLAGIVQYALEESAGGYFQTVSAADARLDWAYYALYSVWAQTTYAELAGMGIGQPEPGTALNHPPLLTATNAQSAINALNPTIDAFMGAFPNVPDTAVFVTNANASDGDPPSMWAATVGGLTTWGAFVNYSQSSWDLNNNGAINSATGSMAANPASQLAQAPIVMTPAASTGQTWTMLPSSGRAQVPTMSSSRFSDWQIGQGTLDGANNQQLDGPLGDLYGPAPAFSASATQTRGQWMTSKSGIKSQLLTTSGTGYAAATNGNLNTYAGMFFYYACNQTNCGTNQSEELYSCPPAGDTACLIPTYYSNAVNPYSADATSTGTATGLFDYNQGLVITNQQGHPTGSSTPYPSGYSFNTNTSQWVNQWGNYAGSWCFKSNECYPGVVPGIDTGTGAIAGSSTAAFNTNGRPVLFDRPQASNDCFFWDGKQDSAADGTGCLTLRTTSSQILPASTNY